MSKNPWNEIDQILKELDGMKDFHSQHPSVLIPPLIKMAKLHAELTKINEMSANRIARLTWGLIALSVALLWVAAKQTRIMLKQDADTQIQHMREGEHDQAPSTNK